MTLSCPTQWLIPGLASVTLFSLVRAGQPRSLPTLQQGLLSFVGFSAAESASLYRSSSLQCGGCLGSI